MLDQEVLINFGQHGPELKKKICEDNVYKFIWFRGEANNFLRFYKL